MATRIRGQIHTKEAALKKLKGTLMRAMLTPAATQKILKQIKTDEAEITKLKKSLMRLA